jgi:hypothetical protein
MGEIKEEWILGLAAEVAAERAKAAGEIYRAGRERAESAVRGWWRNKELAGLCGDQPAVTVGLAVEPLTFAEIRKANGSPKLARVPPEQDASEFALHFPEGIALDVLTTREPGAQGAIARFLAKQGAGVQQVEFRCRDVDRATAILREQFGVAPVYPAKTAGADGTRVNFFLVPGAEGRKVLIELYEAAE